jgi:hypothetical protein
LDIVYSLVGLWGLYIFGMVMAKLRHTYELGRAWYDPNNFVRKHTALGFIEDVMANPDRTPTVPAHERVHPTNSIMRQPTFSILSRQGVDGADKDRADCCGKCGKDCNNPCNNCMMSHLFNYDRHGFSFKRELKEEHPWLAIFCSADIYFFNRQDRITVLFCLLLGDMFLDALLYDGGGKLDFLEDQPAFSLDAVLTDMGLGLAVEMLMLPVYIGILYAFNWVVSVRERDLLYTHLPFEARIFWLHTSADIEVEYYRRRLERGDDVNNDMDDADDAKENPRRAIRRTIKRDNNSGRKARRKGKGGTIFGSSAGYTNDPEKLDVQIEQLKLMITKRKNLEHGFGANPIAWAKDKMNFQQKMKGMVTKMHHQRGELAGHEVVQKLHKFPMIRLLYTLLVKPDDSNYPKIHPNVHKYVVRSYTVAFVWCFVCSFYVFLVSRFHLQSV